jgi:hypothetical protein
MKGEGLVRRKVGVDDVDSMDDDDATIVGGGAGSSTAIEGRSTRGQGSTEGQGYYFGCLGR